MRTIVFFTLVTTSPISKAAIIINSVSQKVYAEAHGMSVTVLDWTASGEWYGFQYSGVSDYDQATWTGSPMGSISSNASALGTDDLNQYPDLVGISNVSSQATVSESQVLQSYYGPTALNTASEQLAFQIHFSGNYSTSGAGDGQILSSNEFSMTFTLTTPAYFTLSAGTKPLGWNAAVLENTLDYRPHFEPGGLLPAGQYQLLSFYYQNSIGIHPPPQLMNEDYLLSFSINSIPEPSAHFMVSLSALGLAFARRRKEPMGQSAKEHAISPIK